MRPYESAIDLDGCCLRYTILSPLSLEKTLFLCFSLPPFLLLLSDNVEMEIVLPGSMTVIDSHDIALALQHKIEAMVDVERAFVHVDHQERDGLEHKVKHSTFS